MVAGAGGGGGGRRAEARPRGECRTQGTTRWVEGGVENTILLPMLTILIAQAYCYFPIPEYEPIPWEIAAAAPAAIGVALVGWRGRRARVVSK